MGDRCPHLDYRTAAGDRTFETPRAYCTVVERFVRPVRADVCNARYDLRPAEHCEYYREREGLADEFLAGDPEGTTGDPEATGGAAGDPEGTGGTAGDPEGTGGAAGDPDGTAGDTEETTGTAGNDDGSGTGP